MASQSVSLAKKLAIGAAISVATLGSYKLYVTGNQYITGTLTAAGAISTSSTVTAPTFTNSSGSFVLTNSGLDATTKTVEAATLSGTNLDVTTGAIFGRNNGTAETAVEVVGTISGTTLNLRGTASGNTVQVNKVTAGSGTIAVSGSTGGRLCIRDRAGSAWTVCAATTGTLSCRAAGTSECP